MNTPSRSMFLAVSCRQKPLHIFLEGLLVNDSLEELDLSSCNMAVDSAWVLLEVLERHSRLRSLRVCENPLGEAGAEKAFNALKNVRPTAFIEAHHRQRALRRLSGRELAAFLEEVSTSSATGKLTFDALQLPDP